MQQIVKCPKCGMPVEKLGIEKYTDETGFLTSKTVFCCDRCKEYLEMDNNSGLWIIA